MYKTRLPLVEPTKLLERVSVDNLRFINPIGHDYIKGSYRIEPIVNTGKNYYFAEFYGESDSNNPQPPRTNIRNELYRNVYSLNTILSIHGLCFWDTTIGYIRMYTDISIITPEQKTISIGESVETTGRTLTSIKLESVGEYELIYTCRNLPSNVATYKFYVVANRPPKTPYTITEVIERILNAGLGAWNGYYKLDPVFAERWKDVPAPEFEITGKTLYEALLMVCGYKDVQAIPRLKPTPGSAKDWEYNFITFDLLNENEEWTPPSGCIAKSWYWDGESYCGGLDSYVDNFVDNSANGSIKQAYPMTPRTETSELLIDDGHAIIKTKSPIYSIQKVEQAYINSTGEQVGDITPYIFEKSEYDNLTSYKGTYPTAKQFAFYYIQGQPNLYGLVLKPETATDIGVKLADMAAIQIAEKKSGQKATLSIANFAYKVTYTPMSPRRIRQVKPTRGFSNSNTLYYNQSANIVESKNYGGRMKGELARIGNKVELETYRLYKLADMPKAGMKKDGKYISQVDWEIQATCIKVTIHLVKNYNRLSEYVGINSLQRFYEVSERQATERQCNFSYISQIGKDLPYGSRTFTLLSSYGVSRFADTFRNTETEGDNKFKIAFVIARAYSKDGTQIGSPTIHEVSGNGIGNSMSFYFAFQDNYSAGEQATYYSGSRKLQKSVAYGDEYGGFYDLRMDFYGLYASREKTAKDQLPIESGGTGFCDALPEFSSMPYDDPLISYRRVIDKNSGEKISVETQIHFQSNDENVIIGTALGEDNLLVASKRQKHTFVCLPYQIEQLQERIPVEDIGRYEIEMPYLWVLSGSIEFQELTNSTNEDALSWACVNEQGNILIAKNVMLKRGQVDENTTINFGLTID